MKHIFLLLLFILVTTLFVQAQSRKDTIKVDYSFWGNSYSIDTNQYSKGEISYILDQNPSSSNLNSSSRTEKIIAYISLITGVLFTIDALQDMYANYFNTGHATPNYYTAGAAIGFEIISIFLFSSSKGKFTRAIKAYNKYIKENSATYNNEFKVNLTYNRIIFSYSF